MRWTFRLFSFCLVFCLLSNSVFASELKSPWVSFLDYDTGGVNGNYLTLTSEARLDYTLPFVVGARSFQGLFMYNGRQPKSVYVLREGSTNRYPCTVLNLGNGLCRFYLTSEANQLNDDGFSILFVGEGTSTVINLLEFEYAETRSLFYAETGWFDLHWSNGSTTVNNTATMTSTSSPVSTHFGTTAGQTNTSRSFICHFAFSDWKNYDFLQFHIRVQADFLNSLSATIGDQPLPFEISYINSAAGTNLYGDIYSESTDIAGGANSLYQTEGSFFFSEHNRNRFDITVTVDVRNCDRHSSYYPKIDIRGLQSLIENYNYVELVYCSGIVEYEPVSPIYSFLGSFANGFSDMNEILAHIYDQNIIDHQAILGWFSEINTSITNFGSSIVDRLDKLLEREDTSGSDDFQDALASQATEMENIDEIFDSVTKPSLDDIDTSVDDIVSGADVSRYTGILRLLLSNSIISSICLMSLTFGFISFVIFGKR